MPTQPDLFAGIPPAYSKFAIPEHYPVGTFQPKHKDFGVKGEVHTGTSSKTSVFVDLSIGECECQEGFAFRYDPKKGIWYESKYCIHKMRMLSSLVDQASADKRPEYERAYLRALTTRYNVYEAVSAFHKELRRGDTPAAWFWGLIVATHRGVRGVFQYLLNIIYEETRDHELALYLIEARQRDSFHNLREMSKAIGWFSASIKKWHMPARYAIFEAEMQGYMRLAKNFGKEVAGHGNVITSSEKHAFYRAMRTGLDGGDLATFQYGLKGLQKLQYDPGSTKPNEKKLYNHRYEMYEWLYDTAESLCHEDHPVWTVISVVNAKITANLGIGYHDLNAIGDVLIGEPLHGALARPLKKAILNRPPRTVIIGEWPQIPLYASDNHTYRGKALMRRFPDQLKASVPQTDLDFRWCGAYFGVAYRMVSVRQHGSVEAWHKVTWPKWLHNFTVDMFY